ncbi:ferric uptake regulator, Fur family [Dehalogenimonas lykanthroporepellens BL-DC-9]|nr:ferric uptake regulator, Fur family [Dehalogenimonas lykanthroporepellens BL-DC-9]
MTKKNEFGILESLRQAGYKLTPQRRAIITELSSSTATLTPTGLHRRLSVDRPDIGLVTVYRTLDILTELGLLCRFNEGTVPAYKLAGTEHHHHLVCRGCGLVTDFSGYCPHETATVLEEETGFRITEHRLEFAGYCRQCEAEK